MKRAWAIVVTVLMWCAIVAYFVFAIRYTAKRRSEARVTEIKVRVVDSAERGLFTSRQLSQWLIDGGFMLDSVPTREVDSRAIEQYLESRNEVRDAQVRVNLEGILSVEVVQRKPIMRIYSSNGYRFWVTDDNYILPDTGVFTTYVPVVTGFLPFPFDASFNGSYDALLQRNWNDFLDQFTKIETQRRETQKKKDIENAKKDSKKNKKEIERLNKELANLAKQKREIILIEKKSQLTHAFLTKLVTFVELVEADDFWTSQIVQINVLGSDVGAWQEPQLELVPRVGSHIILLGTLDGDETAKLRKLRLFYSEGMPHAGWDSVSYINIKYKDQIVCTK
jgi:cell division protein FtsQ